MPSLFSLALGPDQSRLGQRVRRRDTTILGRIRYRSPLLSPQVEREKFLSFWQCCESGGSLINSPSGPGSVTIITDSDQYPNASFLAKKFQKKDQHSMIIKDLL
jgi:hypothetical protein